ncbi:MAG: hypothetical protein NT027_05420 [Proteobacteria bacterium]|nr:hypothetical protein [Pseudomonadota bacterium]
MNVIWKRPDGYHGAEPKDFVIVEVAGKSRLWLHKSDVKWYPFRISGGWQEQEATQRLNSLVNLIGKPMSYWSKQLLADHSHSMTDDPKKFFSETLDWLQSLKTVLKGDTWEVEIMANAIDEVEARLKDTKNAFLTAAQ